MAQANGRESGSWTAKVHFHFSRGFCPAQFRALNVDPQTSVQGIEASIGCCIQVFSVCIIYFVFGIKTIKSNENEIEYIEADMN